MKTVEELRTALKKWIESGNNHIENTRTWMKRYIDKNHSYCGCNDCKYEYNENISEYQSNIAEWMDETAIYKSLLDIALLEDSIEKIETYVRKLIQFHRESKIELQIRKNEESAEITDCLDGYIKTHKLYEEILTMVYGFIIENDDEDCYPNEDGEDEDTYLIQQERRNDFAYQMDNWGMEDY